jgi:ferredoxin
MAEAQLTFKREEREGIVPVGTYLSDAAARLGIRFEEKCSPGENVHHCKVSIIEGEDLLSPRTSVEAEQLSNNGQSAERFSCQAKIAEPGELVIMTPEGATKEPAAEAPTAKEYAKEFAELPLEKKISELVQLEAITLGETFSFIINSPFLVFDKAMDVLAGFGLKKEEREKTAARPKEHVEEKAEAKTAKAPDEPKEDLDEPIPAE